MGWRVKYLYTKKTQEAGWGILLARETFSLSGYSRSSIAALENEDAKTRSFSAIMSTSILLLFCVSFF